MAAFVFCLYYATLSQVIYLYCLMLSGPVERAKITPPHTLCYARKLSLETPYDLSKDTSLPNTILWVKARYAQIQRSTVTSRFSAERHAQRTIQRSPPDMRTQPPAYLFLPRDQHRPDLGFKGNDLERATCHPSSWSSGRCSDRLIFDSNSFIKH